MRQTRDAVTGSRFPTLRRSAGLPAVATFKGHKVFAVSTLRTHDARCDFLYCVSTVHKRWSRTNAKRRAVQLIFYTRPLFCCLLLFHRRHHPFPFPPFVRCPLSGAAVAADGNPATRSARSQAIGGSGQHSLPATFRYDRHKVNCRRARAAWE